MTEPYCFFTMELYSRYRRSSEGFRWNRSISPATGMVRRQTEIKMRICLTDDCLHFWPCQDVVIDIWSANDLLVLVANAKKKVWTFHSLLLGRNIDLPIR